MIRSDDQCSHLKIIKKLIFIKVRSHKSSHLYVHFLRIFLSAAYWEMLAKLGEVREREDGKSGGEKGSIGGAMFLGWRRPHFTPHT